MQEILFKRTLCGLLICLAAGISCNGCEESGDGKDGLEKRSQKSPFLRMKTAQKSVVIEGIVVSGKMPTEWFVGKRLDAKRTGASNIRFVSGPGWISGCILMGIRPVHCQNDKCARKRFQTTFDKKPLRENLWSGVYDGSHGGMRASVIKVFYAVHRVPGTHTYLKCAGSSRCTKTHKLVEKLRQLCANLKVRLKK